LIHAEATLLERVAHQVASAFVGANLTEQPVVGDGSISNRIAAIAELSHNLGLGFGQQVGILLQDFDDVVCRKILVLGRLRRHWHYPRHCQERKQRQCEANKPRYE